MEQELKRKTAERMARTIEVLKKEFAYIRTGRASLALLDGITVNYFETRLSSAAYKSEHAEAVR
jgi:ribosome recycling factor